MTQDIIVSVTGSQFYFHYTDTSEEPVEVRTHGTYRMEDGHHIIEYEEAYEGFTDRTKNRIVIDEEEVRIAKEGVVTSDMIFRKGLKSTAFYGTPFGMMEMGVTTTDVDIDILESSIEVKLRYGLILSGAYVADCAVRIYARNA